MTEIESLLAGEIPQSLEAKTAAGLKLIAIARKIVPVTSLLVAAARRDNFAHDVTGWAVWCRETLDLQGSDRDHRRAIGDLLLDVKTDTVVYNTLFNTSFDKLLALSRISADQIKAFLSHYKVETMKRDELRDAVAEWLGEAPRVRPDTPELPGLLSALEQLDDSAVNRQIGDSTAAGSAMRGGLTLLKIACQKLEPQAICAQVNTEESAQTATWVSLGLLGASLEYHKRKMNVEILTSLRTSLLNEVKELENKISECCTQQNEA